MIVWTAINSAATLFVMLALYLTIRQVGLLLTHLGPGGARSSDVGPRIGENISAYTAPLLGDSLPARERTLYLFASEICPVCAVVRDAAQEIAKHWGAAARIVMVYDSMSVSTGNVVGRPANFRVTAHPTVRERLDVRAIPYAVVTDPAGVVLVHGLVNNASHIESLLEYKNGGVASVKATRPAEGALPVAAAGQREELHA